jgi:hypothetical protein
MTAKEEMFKELTINKAMVLHEDKEHWYNVCKIGQGADCCKYVVGGQKGLECAKENVADKRVIDENWAQTPHIAQSDNCVGYTLHKSTNNISKN